MKLKRIEKILLTMVIILVSAGAITIISLNNVRFIEYNDIVHGGLAYRLQGIQELSPSQIRTFGKVLEERKEAGVVGVLTDLYEYDFMYNPNGEKIEASYSQYDRTSQEIQHFEERMKTDGRSKNISLMLKIELLLEKQ